MGKADNPARPAGQSSADLLIVGGGIMGLWAAVHAEQLGVGTLLVDAGYLGQGASGGVLGALMPHMPDRWSDKKQFQLEALVALETEIARIEAETGLSAGYRRSGRLIPLPKPHLRTIALRHEQDAVNNWRHDGREFRWHVLDAPPVDDWIDPTAGASGFVQDTLAARVAPRSLVAALAAFLRGARHVRIIEGLAIDGLDPDRGIASTRQGEIRFDRCILSAGHRSFPMLDGMTTALQSPLGQPVKGQAALLKADVDPGMPVIFRDGLYVVAHEGGHVAVGSTSEDRFDDPLSTDERLDDLLTSARSLVPSLGGAEVVERWAGLRPKAIDRDPMVGAHPEHPSLIALTGGFKVSFGLAHQLAAAAVYEAFRILPLIYLPETFTLKNHIAVASRKT
ncbi:FAD-binding oxidoreductase [Neorhizobium sp. P12A]|uniref:NAD(P)/FAD-dependent oxidoreductase n=1 Tax=Rhizobium/Agrobacterium group TaxID=227290 RepID=UPI00104F75DA|nr:MULTISPECIES: FAD-binding oxidoreductase [Rhizobium/Agrobacterium group]KAA0700596.1 FAD-binding oxidoreductase [Neorhizobium sp. P12A]TCR92021.1 glycine oxidase [Rhizobium sp. BK376]